MENQDKIFKQFKEAAQKSESRDFPAMEKVWDRVEEKLDRKKDRKVIALWKKLAVAASLLLLLSLGYQFFRSDEKIHPAKDNDRNVVQENKTPEKQEAPATEPSDIIKKDARILLKKQVERQNTVASSAHPEPLPNTEDDVAHTKEDKKFIKESTAEIVTDNSEKTITGVVTDNSGLPIPGVNVFVKGTTNGVQTDLDGKYSIAAKATDTLKFGFIGMSDESLAVIGKNRIDVRMKDDAAELEAVVVEGYKSNVKKKMIVSQTTVTAETIATTPQSGTYLRQNFDKSDAKNYRDGDKQSNQYTFKTKKAEEIKNAAPITNLQGSTQKDQELSKPNVSVLQSLQSQVAGLDISKSEAAPNAKTTVILRGINSVSGNPDPLYVIDGILSSSEAFRALNAKDIKSITVLKDAGATAIYGSRGANGVIVISTNDSDENEPESEEVKEKAPVSKPKIEVSQEEYENFVENPFESPKNAPLSTFSIDVDNASYTNVRRFINNGQTVPKDAVRVEEMVNFFKYRYPQPQDKHPFSINTEYSGCPWNSNHKLLKIGLQGKDVPATALPASNLVFLIDVSGSMDEDNKLPLLVESMKVLVNELRAKDKVTIVVYAGAAGLVLPPTAGNDKKTIFDALEKLEAGGSTAGGEGIELAYKLAKENFIKDGNNRVILATDGDFNVGASSDSDMQTLIEEKRKSGIFLTCLGFGMGNYKDSKMEILADKGNGNYAYIDNIQEANRFLGKEFKGSMFALAKDVKIQIEFNPKHVQSYRLIGYENRKLRPEDFANDAVDAGELGTGHTVTALYEIIPAGVKSDYFKETPDLKYTKTEAPVNDFNDELATIKFRYKKPDEDISTEMVHVIPDSSVPLDNSSDDFKFSAAVAWFGLKLRDSKLVGNKSSQDIEKLAKEGLSNDDDGYKAEFIRLVEAVK